MDADCQDLVYAALFVWPRMAFFATSVYDGDPVSQLHAVLGRF